MSHKLRGVCAVVLVGLLVAALLAGIVAGRRHQIALEQPAHSEALLLSEAIAHLKTKFYPAHQLDIGSMAHGAIRGLLASLGDPYASFLEPEERRLEGDTLQGEFGGIGVLLLIEDGLVTIAEVWGDSPAGWAGLQVGDVVQQVDYTPVSELTLDEVVLLIRGQIGTSVRLQVDRNGRVLHLTAVRGRIELPSLSWDLLTDTIGYVHIHSFTARTGDELTRALDGLRTQKVDAVVLDLRGNGGGVVDGATAVLSQLVGHGIAYRELHPGEKERRHPIPFNADAVDWPLAILIDGGTASAAEIVAAALRDHGRGASFGAPTFGKGSMQGIFELSDGSSIHITIARWLSSDGTPMEGEGVEPEIVIAAARSDGEQDVVLQRAMQYLDTERRNTD